MKTKVSIIFTVLLATLACSLPGAVSPEPTVNALPPTPDLPFAASLIPKNTSTTTQPPLNGSNSIHVAAQHDIGVRVVNGMGEFYNRITGEKFIPRGMNFIRLGNQIREDGSPTFGHSLFDPDKYDPVRSDSALSKMRADGYNVVRVFLSPDTMGTKTGGLSPAYMNNIVDFLNIAKKNQMYVMFSQDWLPGGKYGTILNTDCCSTFAVMNAFLLPPAGLEANKAYFHDFVSGLIQLGAPTEYVFSYELRNEMYYDSDQPPLTLTTGLVTTANGKTYDMSSQVQKQKMLEENNIYFLDTLRSTILDLDPTALVSVGFFVPQEPNLTRIGDPRYVVSAPAIWQSHLDFIDLHAYPGFDLNLKQHVENFGVNGMQEKPIIMGEFGGEISRFASLTEAAFKFRDWQVESCTYGFDGWIFWTWDLDEQPDFFNALMQEGAINGMLAPKLRPDPCVP